MKYKDLQNWINNGCDVEEGLKVLNLDCFFNELTILPPEIGLLRNLQTLHCFNNRLEVLPQTIGLLKNLKYFDCSINELTV